MRVTYSFALLIPALLPISSYATVGGGQNIEVLGYEAKEKKLYVLRHFEDGRGRLPQLYYYQLNSKTPDKLIEVKSLYINPKSKAIDYDQDGIQFDKDLKKITQRLTPLIKVDSNVVQIKVLKNKVYQVVAWHTLSEKIPQYTITYQIHMPLFESKVHEAVTYNKQLKITQNYKIPNQNKTVVVVKYRGIPIETGYDIEDSVLLLSK